MTIFELLSDIQVRAKFQNPMTIFKHLSDILAMVVRKEKKKNKKTKTEKY